MRICLLSAFALGLFACVGCSEFVSTPEQASKVDVVGDPADLTTDSSEQEDIVGFAVPSPDQGQPADESLSISAKITTAEEEPSMEGSREPEVSLGPADVKSSPRRPAQIGLNAPK